MLLDKARDRRKILKKEREWKTKNEKKSNNNDKYFFTFPFLHRKCYIFLENIFGKCSNKRITPI